MKRYTINQKALEIARQNTARKRYELGVTYAQYINDLADKARTRRVLAKNN